MQKNTLPKLFSLVLVLSVFMSQLVPAAYAQSATASSKTASPSAALDDTDQNEVAVLETTEKLRERLQKILGDQDSSDSAAKEKAAYIGEVTRISDEALTLKTLKGSEIIPIEPSTILLKQSKRIPVSDITVGNWLIVIGSREKNRTVRPEVLMVQATDLKPKEHLVSIGVVTGTTTTSVTLIPRGKTEPITLTLTRDSKLIDATGEKIAIKSVPKDVAAIVVGYATNSGWQLGTLKATISMSEYKSASPTPNPVQAAPKKVTTKPTLSPTPKTQ